MNRMSRNLLRPFVPLLFAFVVPAAPAAAAALVHAPHPLPLPAVTATLYISYAGNGYYRVTVDGQATVANASVGVRVRGDDTWFDETLFSMGGTGYARTDYSGRFNLSQLVYRSVLNEDWEGRDEIYATVSVTGGGSTNTANVYGWF